MCQSLVPTASHEDQRGGGDSRETIRDFGLFSLHVNFFHIDLKAGNCLEKWQGREKALQAECIREGLQFADCCRERLRNPPQSVLCGRRWGEGSGRGLRAAGPRSRRPARAGREVARHVREAPPWGTCALRIPLPPAALLALSKYGRPPNRHALRGPQILNHSRGYFYINKNDRLISITTFTVCKRQQNTMASGNSAFFMARRPP